MTDAIISPNQAYTVEFSSYEVRMSHWINQPYLIRVADKQTLFSLAGDGWSTFTTKWVDEATVEMEVARYPGRVSCTLRLNAAAGTGTAAGPTGSFSGTLTDVQRWVLSL